MVYTKILNDCPQMKKLQLFKSIHAFALGIICVTTTAQAALVTTNPDIPPLGGVYASQTVANYVAFATLFGAADLTITVGAPIVRTPLLGSDEREDFMAAFGANLFVNSVLSGPIVGSGSAQSIALSKIGNVTGTFSTEMLSLDITGVVPMGGLYRIRESPTLASLGQTTVTDIGGGLFRIDSFYDVFTELSLDGGATWSPSLGSNRLELNPVPEPSSVLLVSVALLGTSHWRSLRKRSRYSIARC